MPSFSLAGLVVGVYLGVLAGIVPAFIAFAMGFVFKYFTDVTVPGFGVVVLGAALAGISGGLMGLADPQLTASWTGITAILVILMLSLWAHAQGDKLAAATPRGLTLGALRGRRISESLANLVDAYGQVRIRPAGEVQDMEGYPPLPQELRDQITAGSWRFPADLSPTELENRLEERLVTDHDLSAATVTIDAKGRAEIAAAPVVAGLSRRLPKDCRAVSVRTLLPTGMARGDEGTLVLPDGEATGPVVSARSDEAEPEPEEPAAPAESLPGTGEPVEEPAPQAKTPRTHGGDGRVTLALTPNDAKRALSVDQAPMRVESRGKQREFLVLETLKDDGHQFRKVRLDDGVDLVGQSLGQARLRERFGVSVMAIRRASQRLIAPSGSQVLAVDDVLTVVGKPEALDRFEAEVGG